MATPFWGNIFMDMLFLTNVFPEDILSKLLERQKFDEIFHSGYDDDNNNKLYESWTSHMLTFGDVVLFVDVCD